MNIPNPPSTDLSKTTGKPFLTRTAIRGPRTIPKSSPVPTSILSPLEKDWRGEPKQGCRAEVRDSLSRERKKPTVLREQLAFSSFLLPRRLCQSRRSRYDRLCVCSGRSQKVVNSVSGPEHTQRRSYRLLRD